MNVGVTRLAGLVIFVATAAGCDQSAGGAPGGAANGSATAEVPKNPGGGFSADLAAKLGGSGAPRTNAAGSSTPTETKESVKAGSAAKVPAGSAATNVAPDKVETKPVPTSPGNNSTAPKLEGSVVVDTSTAKKPVTVSADLKAIDLALLPNWERDVEGPGTFSLAVKLPNKPDATTTFVFRYGIEDPRAPTERDAYKKWLAENKILTTKDDRQKGAAWYLEGVDRDGKPAFRMVVQYGEKKLLCYGSLYRDSSLGDLRDQTVIQAKQICETVTL